ncbi:hypothetical protein [Desulfobotulus mexicanus]|uniref:Uncharacterized protein n=1 Tax=Desulfobotulus mexicanus TaxID=2586642 RepID=A0A5S5MBG6_9BACT|nr:hypothetical protein [Desulfobotulus mexicanus]TYT73097.1 hypothetical protein FIM25_16930 [Desulfobotulus mexicanus]
MFFEKNENIELLEKFLSSVDVLAVKDKIIENRLLLVTKIIEFISKSPSEWDKRCSFNMQCSGKDFINNISSFNYANPTNVDLLYSTAYRFLCEFDFFRAYGVESDSRLRSVFIEIQKDIDGMNDSIKPQMIYALYQMPVEMLKNLVNNPKTTSFIEF